MTEFMTRASIERNYDRSGKWEAQVSDAAEKKDMDPHHRMSPILIMMLVCEHSVRGMFVLAPESAALSEGQPCHSSSARFGFRRRSQSQSRIRDGIL